MIQIVIFVCFLEESRTPEFAFEIYWPLVKDMKNIFLISFKSFRRFECLIWRLSLEWTLGTHLCSSANRNKCHSLWQEVGDDKPCFIDRWWNLSGRGHLARVLFRRAQWGISIFLKKIHCTMTVFVNFCPVLSEFLTWSFHQQILWHFFKNLSNKKQEWICFTWFDCQR